MEGICKHWENGSFSGAERGRQRKMMKIQKISPLGGCVSQCDI